MTITPALAAAIAVSGNLVLSLGMTLQKAHVGWIGHSPFRRRGKAAFYRDFPLWLLGFVLMNIVSVFTFFALMGLSTNVVSAITGTAVDPLSSAIIASIGSSTKLHMDFGANWNGGPFGIPYIVVPGTQAMFKVTFDYASESDPGPYPIPSNAPIEGGAGSTGDRHVIVVQPSTGKLYELYDAHLLPDGTWHAGSGAIFDLTTGADRPAGWTSADAAGLPILPGLVRYDEVASGVINHAIRFTVVTTRKAYVYPARHYASSNTATSSPPMGTRVRLRADFDISGYPQQARVILQAMKTYGMIVADNGSNWYVSGTADARWNDDQLNTLKNVPGSAFDVVTLGTVTTG